jgi:L-histidine N-alpha-methyltransferase
MAGAGTLRRYVPLDVTEEMIRRTASELVAELPGLVVHGIVGDFERHLAHVPEPQDGPRVVAFLGGTVGNFPPARAGGSCARSRGCCARVRTGCCWAPTS